jgi:redox-sensing transcriptional repressor
MDLPSTPSTRVIPEATLRRLPEYHRLLQQWESAQVAFVSCTTIARALDLEPTQVRKDIEITGIVGRPKVGYPLRGLIRCIEDFLGWNSTKEAFLVGAGSLGSALLGYERFRQIGFDIIAAFDTDDSKVGIEIHGKQVLPLDQLPDLARRMHIALGVIATPAVAAQQVADLMVEGGIRAIWNFAPAHLRVPAHVILQNEDLYHSLAALSFKLEQRMQAERAAIPAISPGDLEVDDYSGTEI